MSQASSNKSLLIGVLVSFISGGCVVAQGNQKQIRAKPQLEFPEAEKTTAELPGLFSGNFILIKRVGAFPEPMRRLYSYMANPGEKYNMGDVVNRSLPNRRLIVGGLGERIVFVHYEKGGFVGRRVLDVYELDSAAKPELLWRGFCQDFKEPAQTVEKLRSLLSSGACKGPITVGKPRTKSS